jgi:hypothetical protein
VLRTVGIVGALLGVALGGTARADDRVAILTLDAAGDDVALASELSSALRARARQMVGWTVRPEERSAATLLADVRCDTASRRCLARVAEAVGADRLIFGTAHRPAEEGDRYVVTVNLYEGALGRVQATITELVAFSPASPASLSDVAAVQLERLSGRGVTGRLIVRTDVPNAEVLVDGEAIVSVEHDTVVAHDVRAGTRQVVVRSPGRDAVFRTVEVGAGSEVAVDAMFGVAPTQPTGPPEPVEVPPSHGDSPRDSGAESAGQPDWLGLGLTTGGAILLGGFAYSALRLGAIEDDAIWLKYRRSVPMDRDACEDAADGIPFGVTNEELERVQSLCSEADALEVLQFVFFGAGVAALGAGIYFLLTGDDDDDAPDATSLRLEPRLSHDNTGVRATLRF